MVKSCDRSQWRSIDLLIACARVVRHWPTKKALVSLLLIVAPLGLGMKLVIEPTVDLELRGCPYGCGCGTVKDELMWGMATTRVPRHPGHI